MGYAGLGGPERESVDTAREPGDGKRARQAVHPSLSPLPATSQALCLVLQHQGNTYAQAAFGLKELTGLWQWHT